MNDDGGGSCGQGNNSGGGKETIRENVSSKTFFGRKYSEHAVKQMGERGVTPSAVEHAIKEGKSIFDPIPGRMQHHVSGGAQSGKPGISVITDSESGRVITVITRSRSFVP